MPRHLIPDYLLKTSVGIKLEGGVSNARIQAVINEFAAEQPAQEFADGIAGFLTISDIPQERREAFLQVLNALG